jgi:hypothetical protein
MNDLRRPEPRIDNGESDEKLSLLCTLTSLSEHEVYVDQRLQCVTEERLWTMAADTNAGWLLRHECVRRLAGHPRTQKERRSLLEIEISLMQSELACLESLDPGEHPLSRNLREKSLEPIRKHIQALNDELQGLEP